MSTYEQYAELMARSAIRGSLETINAYFRNIKHANNDIINYHESPDGTCEVCHYINNFRSVHLMDSIVEAASFLLGIVEMIDYLRFHN